MSRRKLALGLIVGWAALAAPTTIVPAQASADDARLTVTPAVYRTGDSNAGSADATTQLVRYHGYYGGGRGWRGGYGVYRRFGYGYGWGGYGRGFYGRPFYGPYYAAPGFGYGYGNPGYGFGYGYGYGGRRWW